MPALEDATHTVRAKKSSTKTKIDLVKIVADCAEKASYRKADAADMLIDLGYKDPNIYNAIVENRFEQICADLVGKYIRDRSAEHKAEADKAAEAKIAAEKAAQAEAGIEPFQPKPFEPKHKASKADEAAVKRHTDKIGGISEASLMTIDGLGRIRDCTFGQLRGVLPTMQKTSRTWAIKTAYIERLVAVPNSADRALVTSCVSEAQFDALYAEAFANV